jgi:hypothetical protein
MSALEDAALAYAQQGLHVFPLQPNGKTPLTAHGLDDATIDLMTIETWWQRWPNANVAIRTGDIVVVDEDRLGALDELAAEAKETIPQTGVVKTASGRHYYFLQPEGQRIRNTAGRLAPGIDTRGDGGYVVAPPSIHPSGVPYEWVARDETVVMPLWMVERLARRQPERTPLPDIPLYGTTPYGQRALEQEIGAVAVAVEGTRNDQLNRAAFALGQLVEGGEIDQGEAMSALNAAALAAGLPQSEAAKTIASGFTSGQFEPRRAPESSSSARITSNGTSLRAVTELDPLTATQPDRDSWLPLNLNDLPDASPARPGRHASRLPRQTPRLLGPTRVSEDASRLLRPHPDRQARRTRPTDRLRDGRLRRSQTIAGAGRLERRDRPDPVHRAGAAGDRGQDHAARRPQPRPRRHRRSRRRVRARRTRRQQTP